MSGKKVVVIGAGMIGLCCAYYLNKKGFQVTVLDNGDGSDNCSYGNAGYFCPSHIIPLASPGIISQGLKWMLDSQSPFFIKPRLNKDLLSWVLQFKKAATKKRVAKAAPLLHELCMKSKSLIEEILDRENIESAYKKSGLLFARQKENCNMK
jgi:D-amino-acid dehydrogenase